MLLVNFVWQTEGEFHPLIDVQPHLARVTDVIVDGLDVPGQADQGGTSSQSQSSQHPKAD